LKFHTLALVHLGLHREMEVVTENEFLTDEEKEQALAWRRLLFHACDRSFLQLLALRETASIGYIMLYSLPKRKWEGLQRFGNVINWESFSFI
jgi:hypothetical protein